MSPSRPLWTTLFRRLRALIQGLARLGRRPPALAGNPAQVAAYRVLGLAPGADARRVRQAFRMLAVAHHPDRYPRTAPGERAALVRRFSEITAAYHSLET